MAKQEEQRFQSKAQLTALKVHAVVEKVYGVILFPLTWLAEQFGATHVFRMAEAPKARK